MKTYNEIKQDIQRRQLERKKEVIRVLLKLIFWIVVFLIMFLMLNDALSRAEQAECYRWQEEAEQYLDYYLTKWQAEQCNHYGIKIEGVPVY